MKLRPYPAYKESGLPWLGRVPKHWNLLRAKYLMREMDTRSKDGSDTLLSVSQYSGVTKRRPRDGSEDPDTRSSSLVGYKVAKPGNLVSNIMLAWNGSLGIAPIEGVVSPAYCVYRICIGEPWFFHHLLRSRAYKAEIKRRSRGVVDSRLRLYTEDFFRIPMLLPNLKEQQAIVRFVRNLDHQVRRFIRNRRRLIEVLNEQKQAIINRAVTRGLHPDVSLKPSGIDWLGDIPEHWDVFPIKRLFSHMDYGISDSSKDEGRYRVLTMGNIRNGTVTVENCGRVDHVDPLLVLDRHDLLFNRTNSLELVGKVGIFEGNGQDEVTFASYLVRMRVNAKALPQYVNYLLNSPGVLRVARLNAIPSLHQANLNPTRYGRLPVPLPPKAEQATILEYIADRCGLFDDAMVRTQREINLIREYRTRLISDVVTGKVDLRHLAPPPGSEDSEEMAETLEPLAEDTADAVIDEEASINEFD